LKTDNKNKKFFLVHLTGTITEEVNQIIGISVDKDQSQDKAVANLLDSIAESTPNTVISVKDVKEVSEKEMHQFVEGLMDEPEEPRVLQ
jgi:capsular polysaccharide biosynthesis protein